MKERPILFSSPMVRALLAGTKTQTRRIVKLQPDGLDNGNFQGLELVKNKWREHYRSDPPAGSFPDGIYIHPRNCPYGKTGDRLWVRETFGFITGFFNEDEEPVEWEPDRPAIAIQDKQFGRMYYSGHVIFAADGHAEWNAGDDPSIETISCWKPSIHMPRWASRLTLEITAIRCERLQDISEADAKAEGAEWRAGDGCSWGYRHDGQNGYVHDTARESYQELWESINGAGSWDLNPLVWVVEFKKVTP